jgi:adenylate kinase family enzyme
VSTKHRYVFLLGRPGCGKSTIYRELERRILHSGQAKTCERVDDFTRLWADYEEDHAREREGKERLHSVWTDSGECIITLKYLNDILTEVNADLLQIDKPDHCVFVEFARPSYVEAIQSFDNRILENSLMVFMEVSFDTCWARNVARHEAAIATGGDDHLTPREAMEYYLTDDQDAFVQLMVERGIPVRVIDNEADGKEHLLRQVNELFDELF